MLIFFNTVGVIAFAVSGALKALKHELDIFGVLVLGGITAVGGGVIRDVILNRLPSAFVRETDIYIAMIISILTYIFGKKLNNFSVAVKLSDALGLATFAIIGSQIALEHNLSVMGTAVMATLTGVGGGVIRDLLVKETPFVLKEDIYATLCFLGGIIYWNINKIINVTENLQFNLLFIFIIFFARILAVKYKLNLPRKLS